MLKPHRLYIATAPEIAIVGDAIYITGTSDEAPYRAAMSRAAFHATVDRALAILTGPAPPKVARLGRRK